MMAMARLLMRFGFGVVADIAVEQRQIVQGARDVAVDGTMRLLHVRQQLLRQRDGLGIFAGPAELLDMGAARRHALRRRRRREANAGDERQPHCQSQSIAGFHDALATLALCRARCGYSFARASSASLTNIFRNSPGPVTRSGKSSRKVLGPACRSIPSGSQPVQRQSAGSAPSSLVA